MDRFNRQGGGNRYDNEEDIGTERNRGAGDQQRDQHSSWQDQNRRHESDYDDESRDWQRDMTSEQRGGGWGTGGSHHKERHAPGYQRGEPFRPYGYNDSANHDRRSMGSGPQYSQFNSESYSRQTGRGAGGEVGRGREDWRGMRPQQNRQGGSWAQPRQHSPQHEDMGNRQPARQRGRFKGVGPKGFTRSDERLREAVCERLAEHDEIDASEITVDVKNGEVILRGTVATRAMKYESEEVCEQVVGIRDVDNQLRVRRQEGVSAPGQNDPKESV